jgi:hypothetical protein
MLGVKIVESLTASSRIILVKPEPFCGAVPAPGPGALAPTLIFNMKKKREKFNLNSL